VGVIAELVRHPDSPSSPVNAIRVRYSRERDQLTLRYDVLGQLDQIRMPATEPMRRADELWKHTCLEAFVGAPGGEYLELNISPASAWNAYAFTGYREGMRTAAVDEPVLDVLVKPEVLVMHVAFWPVTGARLGLSAVIEAMDGSVSYWALAHPPGKPDFHHADCFAIELPPA
jgi:hypothetical protein